MSCFLISVYTGGSDSDTFACAENGPYHINDDLSLNRSESGWDVNSNMIFVDQPINTGFSYSEVCVHLL